MSLIKINRKERLYVIKEGNDTCLGFDVCERQTMAVKTWLNSQGSCPRKGTSMAFRVYESVMRQGAKKNAETGLRCEAELSPQLKGLEGKRVEVVDKYGETRRFRVGRSTGWMPVHLEIATRRSSGGPAVMGTPFKSVTVV